MIELEFTLAIEGTEDLVRKNIENLIILDQVADIIFELYKGKDGRKVCKDAKK